MWSNVYVEPKSLQRKEEKVWSVDFMNIYRINIKNHIFYGGPIQCEHT